MSATSDKIDETAKECNPRRSLTNLQRNCIMATRILRPIRIDGDSAYIPLTQGYEAVIDASDVHLVDGMNWHAQKSGGSVFAQTGIWKSGRLTLLSMHKFLARAPKGKRVSHLSNDKLDNRKSNIRIQEKRSIRVEGDVAYVTLTKGYEAIIDASDAHIVSGFDWQAKEYEHLVYATRTATVNGVRKELKMHRAILSPPIDMNVDHISGDGLDNRRSNLRQASHTQNMHNQRKSKNNTSGYKGVSFHKPTGKWRPVIRVGGKMISLGLFFSPEDAANARSNAANTYHGDFARHE